MEIGKLSVERETVNISSPRPFIATEKERKQVGPTRREDG